MRKAMQTLVFNSKFKVGDKVSISCSNHPQTVTEVIAIFDEGKVPFITYRVTNSFRRFESHELEHFKEEPKLKVEEYFEVVVNTLTPREYKDSRYCIFTAYFESRKFSTYEDAYDEAVKYFTETDMLGKGVRFTIHKRFGVSK